MRRRRLALALGLAAAFLLASVESSACRKKTTPTYPGPAKLPTAAPYKPPPTRVWPTLLPGQPTLRPPLPR